MAYTRKRTRSYRRRRMPYRRRRLVNRRPYKRIRRNNWRSHPSKSIVRGYLTSDTLYVKLKYAKDSLFTTTATYITGVYRGNDLYDPQYSAGGDQPAGYDQYSALFKNVVVLGSKIKLTFSSGNDFPGLAFVYPSTDPAFSDQDTTSVREIQLAKVRMLNRGGSSRDTVTMSSYMSTSKMYCVSKQEVKDNDLYSHTASTDPTNQWYWVFGFVPYATSSQTINIVVDYEITYYCMFKYRKPLVDA